MSTHKHIDWICLAAVLLALVLTVLFMNASALGVTAAGGEDSEDGQFTRNDRNGVWSTSGATEIVLTGEGGRVTGNGAYIANGDVHILYAGRYVLSGTLTDGSVIIDADGDDKIWLALNGVSLHCEDDAALRVEQAEKVFLTLMEGTENTLSSGKEYNADAVKSGVDGTVYSRDDLTINGSGKLTVTSGYRHGIVCNDDLAITGGTLVIDAAQDGIHANDSARFMDADITIHAGDDGVTVSNDEGTGYIYIASGTLSIPSCYEGLEAVSITIDGGTIDISPTDDGINASGQGGNSVLNIHGGDITIINPNGRDADGLDSNGSIYITGGRVFISVSSAGGSSAIDCGTENGGVCKISGGTVIACGSSLMAEGFDSSSEQAFLMYTTSAGAGIAVSLKSANGTVLLSETIPCAFSSVLLSTPELQLGDTYTIAVGDTQAQVVADNSSRSFGFGAGGMFGGMHGGGGRGGMSWGQGDQADISTDERSNWGRFPNSEDGTQGMPSMPNGQSGTVPSGVPSMPDRGEDNGAFGGRFPNGGTGNGMPSLPEGLAPVPDDRGFADGGTEGWGDGFFGRGQMPGQNGVTDGTQPDGGGRFTGNGFGNGRQEASRDDGTAIAPGTWPLLGISVLFLLAGLLVAVKIKH